MHGTNHRVPGGNGDLTTVHAHATRILTGAQSGGSEGYGSGDKTEVLENFLRDSLSVAKRSVKGLSSSRGGPPRSLRALRERLPPVNEDKPSSAFGYARPKGPGKHETQEYNSRFYAPQLDRPREQVRDRRRLPKVAPGMNPRNDDMVDQARLVLGSQAGISKKLASFLDGDDSSTVVSSKTGTNAFYWKKGPRSVAVSDYPTTAVTSRVESAVLIETMERLERLERNLEEERLRREQTEQQLHKLKGHMHRRNEMPPAQVREREGDQKGRSTLGSWGKSVPCGHRESISANSISLMVTVTVD